MSPLIAIAPYAGESPSAIYDLIVPIQSEEFGIAITRDDQPDLAQIPAFYQQGNGNFWLAVKNGTVIGTIALKDIGNGLLALRKMFVKRDERGAGQGVARALLDHALAWAKTRGCSDVFLGTTAQFLAAHRFYEKNGFVEIAKDRLPPAFPVMAVDTKFYRFEL
jgi:N-acetylglutamate synthase-like GNAT family acetyltransferase